MATVAEINGKLSLDATAYLTSVGKAQSSTKSLETALGNLTSALTSMERAVSRLSSQLGDIDAPARRSGEGVRQMGDSAQRAAAQTEQLGHSADRSGGMLGAFGSKMMTVGVMATSMFAAFAGYKVMNFAKDAIIGFNSTLEGAQMMMGRMLGSEQKATTFINDLKEFAIQTPFQFQDLIKASQQFMVYGWNPDNILRDMETIGSAAMGDKYKIDMITRALGQMKAKGRVSSEEISMQLGESGIPGWRYVAEFYGVTIPEAMKLAEKNMLNVDQTIEAILAGMQRDFGGGMMAASKTFQGAMSNVKDASQQALAEGFRPLFTVMSEGMLKLANFLMSDKMQKATESMKGIAEDLAGPVAEKVDQFISKLEGLNPQSAVDKFKDLTKNLGDFKEILGPIIGLLVGMKFGLGFLPGALIGVIASTDDGRNALKDLGKTIAEIAKEVAPDLAKILEQIVPLIGTMARVLASLISTFARLPGPMQSAVIAALALYAIYSKFGPLLSSLTSAFKTFTTAAAKASDLTASGTGTINSQPVYGPPTPGAQPGGAAGLGATMTSIGRGALVGGAVGTLGATVTAAAGLPQAVSLGAAYGGILGGAIGSAFPLIGTAIGGFAGTVIGGSLGALYENLTSEGRAARIAAEQAAAAVKAWVTARDEAAQNLADQNLTKFYEDLGNAGTTAFRDLAKGVVDLSPKGVAFQRALARMGLNMEEFYNGIEESGGSMTTFGVKLGLTSQQVNALFGAFPELGRAMQFATRDAADQAIVNDDAARSMAALGAITRNTANHFSYLRSSAGLLPNQIVDWTKAIAALKNEDDDFQHVVRVSTERVLQQGGSYVEARSRALELKDALASQLVTALGVSRIEADLLAGSVMNLDSILDKVTKRLFKKGDFAGAVNAIQQGKFIDVSGLVNFRASVGLETTPEQIDAVNKKYDDMIRKLLDLRWVQADNRSEYMNWLAQQMAGSPEIMALLDEEFRKRLDMQLLNTNGRKAQIEYLSELLTYYDTLNNAAEEYIRQQIRRNLDEMLTSKKTDAEKLAALQALKEKWGDLGGEVDNYIAKLTKIPDPSINGSFSVSVDFARLDAQAYELAWRAGISYEDAVAAVAKQWAYLASVPFVPGFARGGRVSSGGDPVVVGENGPELFYPGVSGGYVVPNNKLPSAMPMSSAGNSMTVGNITITINGAADPVATAREVRKELLKTGQRNGSALGRFA